MTTATEAPIKIIDADTADTKSFRKRPSDYFASNFYFCFWFEQGQDMLDAVRSSAWTTACSKPTSRTPPASIRSTISKAGSRVSIMRIAPSCSASIRRSSTRSRFRPGMTAQQTGERNA